tara:strand:- start:1410 stop:1850 length:441 start_codon:yes stop_codon:yes gene_type:complete
MQIIWKEKKFKDLSNIELYKILQLRSKIFVVEQNCVYNDLDNLDLEAYHIFCCLEKNIIGYSRIIDKKENIVIGRIIVEKKVRKKGIGGKLVKKSIRTAKRKIGKKSIIISAQKQWDSFYKKLNFKCTGKEYLEDGIPHQQMIYFE